MSREEGAVRRTSRATAGIPPSKYTPNESVESSKSIKSSRSTASKLKILKLKKLQAENQLQKELEDRQLKFEQQKLEHLERETERELAILEIQTSIEAEKSSKRIESSSEQSESVESSIHKKSIERSSKMNSLRYSKLSDISTENTHVKVVDWLLDNNFPYSKQLNPETEKLMNEPSTTHQFMKEFTSAMTDAFKSVTKQNQIHNESSKVFCRNVVGKELPYFYGNVEDWPMFISLYQRTTETCAYSDEENLLRLQKALKNEALDAVKPLFVSPDNLNDILKTLEARFGRPEFIMESMMNKVKSLPPVNTRSPISFIKFANSVLNLTVTAKSLKMETYINNSQLLSQLVQKLPEHLQFQWARIIVKKYKDIPTPSLKEFSEWLQEESSAACLLCKPSISHSASTVPYMDKKNKTNVFIGSENSSMEKYCRFCSKSTHSIYKCDHFLRLDTDKRWEWVKEQKVCFSCLNSSHRTFKCKNRRRCGLQKCEKYHNRLLHPKSVVNPNQSQGYNLQTQLAASNITAEKKEEESQNPDCFNNEHFLQIQTEYKTVLLRIVPVTVIGPKKSMKTYALFDEGSTVTLMDSNLAEEIGVDGVNDPLKMYWTNCTSYTDDKSKRVNLKIQGTLNQKIFDMSNVRTVSNLKLPVQSVDVKNLATTWNHLSRIPLVNLRNAKPLILIGQDHIDLTIARDVIQGPPNAPVISKSKLGWVVHGNSSYFKHRVDSHYSMTCYMKNDVSEDDELKELMNETILMDNLGVENDKFNHISEEDKKAFQLMEETCRQVENNHWEIGLLWKKENIDLPESRATALNRLFTVEKKMQKDQHFGEQYSKKIENFVEKGYAKVLTCEEAAVTSHKTWYLPHFAVKHPSKPQKFRFVFDARAKIDGINLNENLLKGPDLLNSLVNILFNFRQNRIAVMGDIEKMFLRIYIRNEDQRFLWRGRNKDGPILTYQMESMIFGAICSPSSAIYVLRENAKKHRKKHLEAVKAIEKYRYMDDYLDSFENEAEAIEIVHEVINIHNQGKFRMINWVSNSSHVLTNIPAEILSKSSTDTEKLPTSERTLGLIWYTKDDVLSFPDTFLKKHEKIIVTDNIPTKRELLKVVMSVYDPLGLLAAFTIQARILMQEVWSHKIAWDDKITPDLFRKWKSWLSAVYKIKKLRIPRWYGFSSQIVEIQLHTFTDGSEKGYAAVSYFRMKDSSDQIKTSLVMARSRVTSLKPMTVPRIELQAALLRSRLAKTIENGHSIKIDKKFSWIDSKIVLSWIESHPRSYKTFVANRIGEISNNTNPDEWHWLPTKFNVADEATRGVWNIDNFQNSFEGPQFLTSEEILHTLIVEIEYTVNSHPLTYVSSDHQDVEALTPNHFLIGKSNEVNPLGISADTNSHLRKQWRVAQRYADLFWKRWIREYVPSLIKRSKWQFNSSDVAEGDIVIIADDSFPRNSWPRGKVTRIFPGPDGRVRVVEVTTATGVYRRPITKIILLKPKQ
ncbi:uncharacterized protein [Leptinotarsa decemlineata]|uniref:uncharacterized protein n=1 Tax=Leptinotarsa decemlineata TaxID=7539 RepID=UPI003D30BC13